MKRDDAFREQSKERLKTIATKKIKTTMIGALDSIEKRFGYLWGHNQDDLTQEQLEFKQEYEDLRAEILDKGNGQIRNMETEISQYSIEWLRYRYDIPIQRSGRN